MTAYCSACGAHLGFRSRSTVLRLARIESLAGELLRAERATEAADVARSPDVRSAQIEVGEQVERFVSQGWSLMSDMHAAAHARESRDLTQRFHRWEADVERVLFELLAALESAERHGGQR